MLSTVPRLLSFRLTRPEMLAFDRRHLLLGILGTWIVGMGRYWDDPGAKMLQHLGLGSVIYIFVLAALIWLVVLPLRVPGWTYFRVLTFISLTSFPAVFYAIPVERFVSLDLANRLNVAFLAVVAAWRMGLLFWFLRRFTKLRRSTIWIVTLLPVCAIITGLFALNLHRVVFNIMGGIRGETAHGSAYVVLMFLTIGSVILVLPLLAGYLTAVQRRRSTLRSGDFD